MTNQEKNKAIVIVGLAILAHAVEALARVLLYALVLFFGVGLLLGVWVQDRPDNLRLFFQVVGLVWVMDYLSLMLKRLVCRIIDYAKQG